MCFQKKKIFWKTDTGNFYKVERTLTIHKFLVDNVDLFLFVSTNGQYFAFFSSLSFRHKHAHTHTHTHDDHEQICVFICVCAACPHAHINKRTYTHTCWSFSIYLICFLGFLFCFGLDRSSRFPLPNHKTLYHHISIGSKTKKNNIENNIQTIKNKISNYGTQMKPTHKMKTHTKISLRAPTTIEILNIE